ncbi:MAG: DUF2279 domain-containing protein [Bacteroidetes bacterium]|nr:DUF2279 domain-containing protein [Bacteroidota bacterium]
MSNRLLIIIILGFVMHMPAVVSAQDSLNSFRKYAFLQNSTAYNNKRVNFIIGSELVVYTGLMIGLNEFWYKDFKRTSFHIFNDNIGWMQMDKAGHVYSAYLGGKVGMDIMRWAGVSENKAIWTGGLLGSYFLTTIEILDGFSSQWGFSPGDLIANTAGSFLTIGQQLAWKEQRLSLKFSFHRIQYPSFQKSRAEDLYGTTTLENMIKDYNGQTYWLSMNLASFGIINKAKWLNVSFGYSVAGMLGAESNVVVDENEVVIADYSWEPRYRQYFFSLDVDLTRIKTRSRLLQSTFGFFNFIKFPFPAVGIGNGKLRFHPLYF